ncbi:capsule biosynthesis protein [Roseomonas sp. AR75]|uniref:capsule biosynthesis protein n=1 Tax=Roseomonas sp. AR75 TaxID=2562311 RepID=UPI001485A46A|nr:capsule biosynthesis protein [Roseomonas sp. AR75]
MRVRHWYILLVLLPTLLVGGYYVFYAANIYESEARFLVRNRSGGGGGGADMLGGSAGGIASALSGARPAVEESRAVASWISSYSAVTSINKDLNLVEMWRRPEADEIGKLWWEQPKLEWLAWYFRRRVIVSLDPETGVMQLRVHAFRPEDAHRLAQDVLRRSEDLVNTFSARSIADTLRAAQEDVNKAESRVLAAREALIAFREREQAFDPASTAGGAVATITALETALATARTEYEERRRFMRPDNPQLQVLQNRVAALQQQITTERARVTRGDERLTQQVAAFERLELERMMADRELGSAVNSLESARSDALRQQVFVMRVSEPQMPEYALYPRATFNTLTVFVSLTVLFGIGWMLVVSAREHAS